MRKLDMAWINGNIYTADDKFFYTFLYMIVTGDTTPYFFDEYN